MVVFVLLAIAWAAVLVPPALSAHAARREAFLDSLAVQAWSAPARTRSDPVQRRRRIAGGLLLAMAGTLLAGLLPTFRVLLYVHLFLVDSFLAYIALLAHVANRAARGAATEPVVAEAPARVPRARRPRRQAAPVAVLRELGPIA